MNTSRTYFIDTSGRRWAWSCGWRHYDREGKELSRIPLPHRLFRKTINLIPNDSIHTPFFRASRPYGPWRRGNGLAYDHPLYGTCLLVATDGIHAIVRDSSNTKREVAFANLTAISSITPEKPSTKFATNPKTRGRKKSTGTEEEMKAKLRLMDLSDIL